MYEWVIFAHLLGIFGFLLAHGAAAAVSFRLRGERELTRIGALLELSRSVTAVASASLLLLLVAGVILGFLGHWWGQGWIWTSLGLFLLMGVGMMALGSRPFNRTRQLLAAGERSLQPAGLDKEVAAALAALHPIPLTLVGGAGLAIILWLMLFKPF